MRHKFVMFLFLCLSIGMLSGCAALLIGGVAGYEVSSDSVKGDLDVSYDRLYDGSLETIRAMGGLSIDKKTEGWVKSEVDGYNVAIHVVKLTDTSARLTVSAHKFALPKLQYAKEVMGEVLKRVKQQPVWLR